ALPVYDYEDLAADEAEAEYAKLRPPFAETFSPPLPGGLNYGKSLFWQARSFPEEFARARHILSYAQYWSWMLCGVAATECTTIGSHSDLWRPREGRFSSLPARLGWEKLFPPLRRADEVLGTIRPELAQAIGVNPDVRVACGIHDSNASLLPWLGRAQPFSIASTGTWVINFALGASLDALDPARDCASNVSIRNEPVPSSRWMGGREFGLLVGDGDPAASAEDLAAALDREECMVLPNQGGQGGPFQGWPDMPAGDLAGALGERGAAAAAALYCALMLDVTLDLVASAGDVIIEGSFARNELLAALLAALRPGQDVYVSEDQTGTTNGALRLLAPKLPPPAAAKVAPLAAPAPVLAHRERWRARLRELRPSP
ncbi:MAG: hypothetical protein ISN26_04575, partial [Betaproteobacteria bacterium AqS2]|nr:hypothetical protein [Betaproteobacteria bacterium AqS2]